ncbi:riboflavin kinase/FMN adenylyltransferase [Neomicrococcus aestuarii]|uniref:Riboflavin biosynthesis protein n=1 Tax=Neomicrococcus aestuarii TaxID=556325 RepID=A0A7W8TRJ9_9MICC|nr:bifunctional riboflavin kinase/FAD synthetase [Neomicrococcus aestuarii]MBB5511607.1 riboflavin kinase/FMN adenylyltransferase [Neomicrococcus aestuarii]
MDYWEDLGGIPAASGPSVVTIGNFDGVHRGHREVLSTVVKEAKKRDARSVVITFDPHPALVHRPEAAPNQIMGLSDKKKFIEEVGVDALLVLPYTLEFSKLTAEEFVTRYIAEPLKACAVVVGHDVRFGRDNEGDFRRMQELGEQLGFDVIGIDDFGEDRRCSSTWVREALADGEVEAAAEILGRPHRMVGEVIHGAARGRELGFPTANLSPESTGFIPADGVYAGWLIDEGNRKWPAAISVGSNPTFEGVPRQVEAHVIDRKDSGVEDFNLYGQRVVVEFVQRLRPMVAYRGIEALVEQITEDVERTREVLLSGQ